MVAMGHRLTLHIVDRDSRARAEEARIAFALGHHAEVYADLGELVQHHPREGIVIARDGLAAGGALGLLSDLSRAGIWLPLIVVAEAPDIGEVVAAIKAGALEFLQLPLERERLDRVLASVARELSISPRTVEIHRANMMEKLGAGHAADAVRLRMEARLGDDSPMPRRQIATG